jgi:class 3 adenylate cyclase/DNA-binding transcriptional MerR regulator
LNTNLNSSTISSKELIAKTGISRATLNNYISLNLIPSPSVRRPEEPGGPTKIGYFPLWVVERIEKIQEMKASGMRMAEIAIFFMEDEDAEGKERPLEVTLDFTYQSIERIVFPAILVNSSWEIIWINQSAEKVFFQESIREIPTAANRNILRLFLEKGLPGRFKNWKEILSLHLRLAKRDLSEDRVEQICRQVETCPLEELKKMWREAKALQERPITQQDLVLRPYKGKNTKHTLFSSDFREGTLLLYTPVNMQLDQILNLLMGREKLVKALLSRRIPSLTSLCILAGRLESSLHLRTALPPHEYFDLLNQVILTSHQCFKDYGGTPGRSIQEGVVCFFLSAPDSPREYLHSAIQCAQALKQIIATLDKRWKYKKVWKNTLQMNMSIHCGEEWLGTIPSSLAFDFTVMGESLIETVKLSEFAEAGSIWASKKVIENMSPGDRQRVDFGVRLGAGRERFVSPGIYSQVKELLSPIELQERGLKEISSLAVTEIINVHPPEEQDFE